MRRDRERVFDEYLAAAARAGDRAALERLAARWSPRLYRHARRLTGDADMALEAAQEGWIDIVRNLPRLGDAAAFPAWAFRIVTRRCADEIQRRQRSRRLNAVAASGPPRDDLGAAAIEANADAAPLRKALSALPPEQRAAIALFHLEGFSVAEIAAALGVPAGTVKTRLMHARRKMRAALDVPHGGGKSDDRS